MKQKPGPSKTIEASKEEKQAQKVGEAQTQEFEDPESWQDDPPPQADFVNPNSATDINDDPTPHQDSSSPKQPSLVKHLDKTPIDGHIEEVIVTGSTSAARRLHNTGQTFPQG